MLKQSKRLLVSSRLSTIRDILTRNPQRKPPKQRFFKNEKKLVTSPSIKNNKSSPKTHPPPALPKSTLWPTRFGVRVYSYFDLFQIEKIDDN